jgi:hypothetical protein
VEKRDPPAPRPPARCLVHEAVSGGAATLERSIEIRNAVANVMDAWSAFRDELRDRSSRIPGFEQLDVGVSERDAHHERPVHRFRRAGSEAEYVPVEGERLRDAGHGNADVRDGWPGH